MNNKDGFTLLEVMVVVAIGAVLSLLLVSIFVTSNKFMLNTAKNLDSQTKARQVLDLLSNEIRRNDITGRIECSVESQVIRINSSNQADYKTYFYKNGYFTKFEKKGAQEQEDPMYEIAGFEIQYDNKNVGKYTVVVKYLNAHGEEEVMQRLMVSRTAK
ncbi:PilW family protein [Fusibacter sp. JL216-2]|uniref:PilW family protein n=1 Tax=Fusibacter sp. JL216-2 TaxID=3071453 RepID=UPI003D34F458